VPDVPTSCPKLGDFYGDLPLPALFTQSHVSGVKEVRRTRIWTERSGVFYTVLCEVWLVLIRVAFLHQIPVHLSAVTANGPRRSSCSGKVQDTSTFATYE